MCVMNMYVLCAGNKVVAAIRHRNCLWLCDSRTVNLCIKCHHYQRNMLNSDLMIEKK